jgi:Do/DeqQ family serine protease
MNESRWKFGRPIVRAGIAVAAGIVLLTGAAWRISAESSSAAKAAATHAAVEQEQSVARANGGRVDSYADTVKVVAPAVVTIHADGRTTMSPAQFQMPDDEFFRRFFGDPGDRPNGRMPRTQRQSALGSGVIVSTDGYILTNNHVVDSADSIHVELTDGRSLAAKVVGTDKASDLALLKIGATNLHAIEMGNSEAVQVGDVVLAVGNPLGVGQTVTMGIISAKGRSTGAGSGSYEDFLQTDAPINHGNSGGALVNTRGQLVGINSQILSNSNGNIGIGFAIPSNMAKHVMDELRTKGKVTRAQLGVSVQMVTSDMAESLGLKEVGGAIIGSVTPGSAADKAGLRRGDVIMAFNGQPIHDTNTLRNRVAESAPGSTADLTIVRDGAQKHMSVKLDEASAGRSARAEDDSTEENDKAALGISVVPMSTELASRYRLPRDAKGLLVQDVNPDGRAAEAGIQAGDLIEEVNRQPVTSVDELKAAVKKTTDRPLLLLVNRQGNERFVTVRPSNG